MNKLKLLFVLLVVCVGVNGQIDFREYLTPLEMSVDTLFKNPKVSLITVVDSLCPGEKVINYEYKHDLLIVTVRYYKFKSYYDGYDCIEKRRKEYYKAEKLKTVYGEKIPRKVIHEHYKYEEDIDPDKCIIKWDETNKKWILSHE